MRKLSTRAPYSNGVRPFPLLDFAERTRIRLLPLPARWLVARFGLSPATALAVAAAAGFNIEGDR